MKMRYVVVAAVVLVIALMLLVGTHPSADQWSGQSSPHAIDQSK
ncbi:MULTISPECIES: hypothetical protein [unclassified Sinorhizobium]